MNNFMQRGRRSARVRVASWPRFAASLLLLASFVSGFARAQTPTPQTGGEQDKRGIVVRPDSQQKTATPEEQKARGTRPELVLQTGYTLPGMIRMQFSPDGRLLATLVAMDSQVKLWEVATGRELRTLAGSTGAGLFGMSGGFYSIAFSRDGRQIAAGGYDGSIKVWDVSTGRETRAMGGTADGGSKVPIFQLAFGPDNRTLVATGLGVSFWDVSTGQRVRSLDMPQGFAGGLDSGGLTFTPDGSQLLLIAPGKNAGENSLRFIEITTGREARHMDIPDELQDSSGSLLAYASDGHVLAAAGVYKRDGGHQFKLWDLTAGGGARSPMCRRERTANSLSALTGVSSRSSWIIR